MTVPLGSEAPWRTQHSWLTNFGDQRKILDHKVCNISTLYQSIADIFHQGKIH